MAAICHRSVPKEDLESLTGLLQFATKIVRPSKPLLRRLYALQAVLGSQPDYLLRFSVPAQANILWWIMFADKWNSISLYGILDHRHQPSKFIQIPQVHGVVELTLNLSGSR